MLGGNALKMKTSRMDLQQYNYVKEYIAKVLLMSSINHFIPLSFQAKDSFGDVDVIIDGGSLPNDFKMYEYITNAFNPNEIYTNSNMYSFDVNGHQVDFVVEPEEKFICSSIYNSYNDLGNFMGVIARSLGYVYGNFGLKYIYREKEGGQVRKIQISRDIPKIFDFLGFNFNTYMKGFYYLEDIFAFVCESKYFHPSLFEYDALNHANRTRNKKRKNYTLFLEYVEGKYGGYEEMPYGKNKKSLQYAEEYFGEWFHKEVISFKHEIQIKKDARKHFNGGDVLKHTDLEAGDLNDFFDIWRVSRNIDNKVDFSMYLLEHSKEELILTAKKFAEIYKLEYE